MTPRLSVIGSAIRKLFGEVIGLFGDYHWNNVVTAMKMETVGDSAWSKVVLASHFDQPDPYWSNTALAMHMDPVAYSSDPSWNLVNLRLLMDGADNGTAFTEMTGKTATAVGSAVTKTATKKFGTASLYINGATGYVNITPTAALQLTGDFTVEFWVNVNSTAGNYVLFSFNTFTSAQGLRLSFYNGGLYLDIGAANLSNTSTGMVGGTWYHLAVTRSGTAVKVFVNGSQVISGTNSTTFSGWDRYTIGAMLANGSGEANLAGYIDDFRVTKDLARYTSNFTAPTDTLPYYSNVVSDLKGKAVTTNGNAALSTTQSKFGGSSCSFDGTGDYIDVANSADFSFGTGDFTVEFWVWTDPVTTAWSRLLENEAFNVTGGWHFSYNGLDAAGSRRLGFQVGLNGGGGARIESLAAIPTSTWVHIAVCRASGVIGMFVNGALQGTLTTSEDYTSQKMRLGATLGTASNFFTGYLDDLRITKGVARYVPTFVDQYQPNVVLGLHMDGANGSTSFTDITGKTVTAFGNAQISTTQSKFGGASGYFDGSGDYLTTGVTSDWAFLHNDTSFTVEAWVYWSGGSADGTIMSTCASSADVGLFFGVRGSNSNRLDVQIFRGSIGVSLGYVSTSGIPANTWVHIAFTYTSGSRLGYFYINGVQAGVGASSGGMGTWTSHSTSNPTYTLAIGRYQHSSPSGYFNGYIDDLRITRGVARYTADFTAPSAPFPDPPSQVFTTKTHAFPDPVTNPIFDEKGKSFTLVGTPTLNTTTKKYGDASLSLNGTTDHLVVPLSADFGFGAGDFTVECWVNTTASSGAILDWRSELSDPCTYISVSVGNLGVWNGDQVLTGSTQINTGAWVHVTVQRLKGVIQGFVNGVLDLAFDSESVDLGASRALYIGATIQPSAFLAGYLDDLRITKGLARYAGNFTPNAYPFLGPLAPAFLEETGKIVTTNGAAQISTAQKKFGKASAKFDGANDRVKLPVDSSLDLGAGDFTIECWVYRTGTTVSGGTNPWMLVDGRTNGVNELYIAGNNSDNTVHIGHNALVTSAVSSTAVQANQWYHIAVTRHSGTMFLFINGTLEGLYAYGGNVNLSGATIGGRYDFTSGDLRSFNGYIDDLRITKGVARYIYNPPALSSDAFWSSVVLGMPMDGTNGSTTFTDLKGKTVTRNGDAVISTAQSKFGGASSFFDGDFDYLSVPSSSDFDFGSEAFTIECWVYPTAIGGNRAVLARGSSPGTLTGGFWLGMSGTYLIGYMSSNSGWSVALQSSSPVMVGNTWQHLAISKSGSNWFLFHNGVKVAENTYDANPVAASTGPVVIGIGADYVNHTYAGYIDDVRITKGVSRYSANFTPVTSTYLPSSSVYAPVFTPANLTIQNYYGTPYDTQWPKVVLGLHMDGSDNGVTFNDACGKTVTPSGNAVTKTAVKKFGTASAYFDGTGDYLTVPSSADFEFGSGDFTIECWAYFTSLADFRTLWSRATSGTTGPCLWATVGPDGTFYGYASTTGTGWNRGASSAPGAVVVNAWTHLAFTRSGGNLYVFVNGVLSGTDNAMSTSTVASSTGVFLIGTYVNTTQYQMLGYIDDFRVTKGIARYTANFQPDQFPFPEKAYDPVPLVADKHRSKVVLGMHMDGADNGVVFTDITGKSVSVSGNAVTKTAVKKFGTASAYFDGTGDYLTVPHSSDLSLSTGDFTIEVWIYPLNVPTSAGQYRFIVSKDNVGVTREWALTLVETTGCASFALWLNNSTNLSVTEPTPPTVGVWTHYAVVRSGNTLYLFRDGVQVAINTSASGVGQTSTSNLLIGTDHSAGVPQTSNWTFNGYIDDLRITKGVARYTAAFNPPGRFPDAYNLVSSDQYGSFVILGMHMDGADNGTYFPTVAGGPVTITSAVTKTGTAKFGGASAYFNGASLIRHGYQADYNFGTGDWTIEFWIYGGASGTVMTNAASYGGFYGFRVDASTTDVSVVLHNSGQTNVGTASSPAFTQNAWHHIAIVRSGASVRVYSDGVSGANLTLPGGTSLLSMGNLTIGAYYSNAYLTGYLDDIRITKGVARYTGTFVPPGAPFPLVVSTSDMYRSSVVLGLHMDGADNGTTFTDITGKTVTRSGNTVTKTAVKKFGTASTYFDGAGDYLTVPSSTDFNFGTGDFTIEAWIYAQTTASGVIVSRQDTNLALQLRLASGNIEAVLRSTSGGSVLTLTGGSVTANAWTHVAVTRYGGSVRVFKDGISTAPQTFSTALDSGAAALAIGILGYDNTAPFTGYIDDLRITKGIARYASDFVPPTTAFQDT